MQAVCLVVGRGISTPKKGSKNNVLRIFCRIFLNPLTDELEPLCFPASVYVCCMGVHSRRCGSGANHGGLSGRVRVCSNCQFPTSARVCSLLVEYDTDWSRV